MSPAGGRRPGSGRKPYQNPSQIRKTRSIRFSDHEWAQLDQQAQENGYQNISDYIRHLAKLKNIKEDNKMKKYLSKELTIWADDNGNWAAWHEEDGSLYATSDTCEPEQQEIVESAMKETEAWEVPMLESWMAGKESINDVITLFNWAIEEEVIYIINYNTGAGNETAASLEEAMAIADKYAAYTQQDITIDDQDGNVLARRSWWGCRDGIKEQENPIDFGDYGFYGDWEIN